jgi:SH3-like domain-containing protein
MVMVQLIILAVQIAIAIAQAAVTFGASLLQVPIFQQLARTVISNLVQEAVFKLMEA